LKSILHSSEELARVLLQAHERYQGDFVIVFSDVYVEAEAMGCRLEFPDDAPPHVVKPCPPLNLRGTTPQRDGRLPIMLDAAQQVLAYLGATVPVFVSIKDPFSAAALASGSDSFFELLIAEPALARRAIEVAHQNQLRYLEALLELGANVMIGAPMASGGVLGPKHFRTFALPSIGDLATHIRAAGRFAGLHICGDSDPILDQLAQIPAHFLSLESFNPTRWKELVSDGQPHPALMGYFPTHSLMQSSDAEIAREVAQEIASLWGFPHILATACDVPHRCPPAKVQSFLRAARAWRAPS
jgi:uroporphyrinogen decarboxylase